MDELEDADEKFAQVWIWTAWRTSLRARLPEIRMAAKAGKSRHALRNIAAFASRAYMASDHRHG